MKNLQPPEKRVPDSPFGESDLQVHSVFYTIQGEGPFSGVPAVFVRLAGCNLQCPGCDTDYTTERRFVGAWEVFADVKRLLPQGGLVVITGGEPLRQPQALFQFCSILRDEGYYVQIETNGTLNIDTRYRHCIRKQPSDKDGVYVVVSPKTGTIHASVHLAACAYKYVMDAENVDPHDGLPTFALDHSAAPILARPVQLRDVPVYLQPRDEQDPEKNKANLAACIASCMKYGYTLQLQIHKIIGVP